MTEKHVCKTATGGCMCQPDDDGVVRCRREAEGLRTAAEARIEQHNKDTHQPVIMDDGEDLTYIDAMDQARDRDDAAAKQDALDVQHEADAMNDCIAKAKEDVVARRTVRCADCSGCDAGKEILAFLERERARQIERSAAEEAELELAHEDTIGDDGGYT